MKFMTFPRSLLLACFLLPACGDDKGDDTTATDGTSNATPATPASGTDTMDVPTTGGTDTTVDPSGDPSTDPSGDPGTTNPTVDPTEDPTAGDGQFCIEECAADGDCTVQGGMDIGLVCTDGRCTGDAGGCADDAECVALFSGWAVDCVDQAGCPGQVCIDIGGGVGKCATAPSDFLMCETILLEEVMFPAIEGGMDLTVCANPNATCNDDGVCIDPCKADADCPNAPYTKCNLDTGACNCSDDAACMASNANTPACTANGFCGCAEDANCTASMLGDVCNDGSCGCSDVSACTGTKVFDNTMFVCEGA